MTDTNESQAPATSSRSGTGMGFLMGIIFSLLLAAYPMYVAFSAKQETGEAIGQQVMAGIQMQITLTHKELESIERQLHIIAEAEQKYSQLVEQKFDLETTQSHLDERLAKLQAKLDETERELNLNANQFDQITQGMRLD